MVVSLVVHVILQSDGCVVWRQTVESATSLGGLPIYVGEQIVRKMAFKATFLSWLPTGGSKDGLMKAARMKNAGNTLERERNGGKEEIGKTKSEEWKR